MTLGHVRSLIALGPAANDRPSAVRLTAGVAVPTGILILLDQPELTIYAVFGSFTGMFGRNEPRRTRHQLPAALLLMSGVAIGVAAGHLHIAPWPLVVLQSTFAFFGSLYADRFGLRPGGPFFGMFALGACASVSGEVAPWPALGVALIAALISLGFGVLGPTAVPTIAAPTLAPSVRRAIAYFVTVCLAGALSTLFGLAHPVWAMAAAAVPLAVSGTANRVRRGTHRILGTLAGIVLTAAILLPFGIPHPIALASLIVILQYPTELFIARNYGIALVFFTPLILIMTQLANPIEPGELITDRALQTALGALIGIVVATLPQSEPRSTA